MREKVKEAVAVGIRWSPLPALVRLLCARRRASILFYHDPEPELFERHLAYLSTRYSFTTLETVVDAIRSGDWSRVPPRALVITFDDGHAGTFRLLDSIKRHRVRPTIYLCSQVVGTHRHYWFKEMGDSGEAEIEALKRLSEAARREALDSRFAFQPEREYPETTRQALSRDEIALMRDHVDFQAHTRFHPVLTMCSESECWEEIASARGEVADLTQRDCDHFSYPNGDYGGREREFARRAGYVSARSIDVGWNGPGTDLYRLKVLGTPEDASVARLAADLTGFWFLLRMTSGSLNGRHLSITPEAA